MSQLIEAFQVPTTEITTREAYALESMLNLIVENRRTLLPNEVQLTTLHFNLEGAPIYLVPNTDQTVQAWDNPAFARSWQLLTLIHKRLNSGQVAGLQPTSTHWMLIDDVHNLELIGIPDQSNMTPEQELVYSQRLSSLVHSMADAGIPMEAIMMESAVKFSPDDSCFEMDGRFQAEKMLQPLESLLGEPVRMQGAAAWSQRRNNIINPIRQGRWTYGKTESLRALPLPVQIIIHPEQFRGQQIDMARELRASINGHRILQSTQNGMVMTHDTKYGLNTTTFVGQTYNVWLDDVSGAVTEISRPEPDSTGRLQHRTLIRLANS